MNGSKLATQLQYCREGCGERRGEGWRYSVRREVSVCPLAGQS